MKELIISYKSRNNLMQLQRLLKQNGVASSIVSTPRNISVSCGLSIKTQYQYLFLVKKLIVMLNLSDFNGVFLYERKPNTFPLKRLF